MMKKTALFLAAVLLSAHASAQYSGAEMLKDLRAGGTGYVKAAQYTRGIMDGLMLGAHIADTPQVVCPPNDVTTGRATEIVRRRLEDTPSKELTDPAAGFIVLAAFKEWPCQASKQAAKEATL